METHPRPDEAKSDGPNMLELDRLPQLIEECLRIRQALSLGHVCNPKPQAA